jgi:hypothetical protein
MWLETSLDNRLCGGKNAYIYYGSIEEGEAMCGADLSDVVMDTSEEDKINAQKKRPKNDADNEAGFVR